MAGGDLGEGTRLAAASRAWICFEDEAGESLRPPKARTWAPRGQVPVIKVPGKGSGRVPAAGLACLKPGARGHLFCRVRVHRGRKGERRSMSEAGYAGLIAAAHQQLHATIKCPSASSGVSGLVPGVPLSGRRPRMPELSSRRRCTR